MKSIIGMVLGLFTAASPVAAQAQSGPLSDAQIIMAVDELSGGDRQALDIARRTLAGKAPDYGHFMDLMDDYRAFTVLATSLGATDRMAWLDWKEGLEESEAALSKIFAKAGLDPSESVARLRAVEIAPDEIGVGHAYLAYRAQAEKNGMRIIGLNGDADAYYFVLVPEKVAQRWQSVKIGENQYVEDSDWQFRDLLEEAGIEARSTVHPAQSERPAPKAR